MKLTLSLCRTGSCLPGLSILIALTFLASPIFSQNVLGFLFNNGNGRTSFKHAVQPLGGSSYLMGGDTLNLAIS
jgi:hypothetical protein